MPRVPAEQLEIARQQSRIAAQAIEGCTPLPHDLVQRALAGADHADKTHASEPYSQRGERAGECLESILCSLGLKAGDPVFYSRDEDGTERSAYERACAEAREVLGREAVKALAGNVSTLDNDATARFAARLRLRSAIRAKAVDDLQAAKALRAANAGNSQPMAERIERQRQERDIAQLADTLASYDATYGSPRPANDVDPFGA
jgi:hypothetical protein